MIKGLSLGIFIIRDLYSVSKIRVLLIIVCVVLTSIAPTLSAWLTKLIIDSGSMNYAMYFILTIVSAALLNIFASFMQDIVSNKYIQRIRGQVSAQVLAKPYGYLESSNNQNLLSRVYQGSTMRPIMALSSGVTALRSIVTIIVFTLPLTQISMSLFIILITTFIPVTFFAVRIISLKIENLNFFSQESRLASYLENLAISPWSAKQIKSNGLENWIYKYIMNYIDRYLRADISIKAKNARYEMYTTTISLLGVSFIIFFSSLQLENGVMTAGEFVFIMTAMLTLRSSIESLSKSISGTIEHTSFFRDTYNFLNEPLVLRETSQFQEADSFELSVNDVSFHYENQNSMTLDNVTFSLSPGLYAVVGDNGSGKSTLVKLLAALYSPTSGSIRYKVESKEIDRISVLFQDFLPLQLSVLENICLDGAENYDPDKLKTALRISGFDQVMNSKNLLIETNLGRQFHSDGMELSGGEWQKLAIARALYSYNGIMILDEPTSSLDELSERNLIKDLKDLAYATDGIILYVSHRFNTIVEADEVLYFEKGQLKERGNHGYLVSIKGSYYERYSKVRGEDVKVSY